MIQRSNHASVFFVSFILQTSIWLLLVTGCSGSKAGPPELVADKIACAKCNMLLSETRFAAAFQLSDGQTRVFDDVGCMLGQLRTMPKLPDHIWVRDYEHDTWLDARAAIFVASQQFGTPMNYGFIALGSAQAADELARSHNGKVLAGFDTLILEFRGIS